MWHVLVKWSDATIVVPADRWTITDGTLFFYLENAPVGIFAGGEWICATRHTE